jgi:hypothetical protein
LTKEAPTAAVASGIRRVPGSKPASDVVEVEWDWVVPIAETANAAALGINDNTSWCTANGTVPVTVTELWTDGSDDGGEGNGRTHSKTVSTRVVVVGGGCGNTGVSSSPWARVTDLRPGAQYHIAIGGSDPVRFRTAGGGTTFIPMYRVSEYTIEIDLLDNHNSASRQGQAAFLTSTNDNDFFKLAAAPITECVYPTVIARCLVFPLFRA